MTESVLLELDGVEHEIAPPPDLSLPHGCPGEAQFAGRVPGLLSVAYDVDLDTYAPTEAETMTEDGDVNLDLVDDIGTILGVNLRLRMSTDREAAEKPTMTCAGAASSTTVTAGPPFGFIPGEYPLCAEQHARHPRDPDAQPDGTDDDVRFHAALTRPRASGQAAQRLRYRDRPEAE